MGGFDKTMRVVGLHELLLCRIQAYVKFLVQDEDVARLHALCSELMGPYHAYVLC